MVLWDESDDESTIKLLQKHSTKDGYELYLRNAIEKKWIAQTTKGVLVYLDRFFQALCT